MAKKETAGHVRVTVTVPEEVRQGMAKMTATNWSAVASKAFADVVNAANTPSTEAEMAQAKERLLASKQEGETLAYTNGFKCGVEWAKDSAEYRELKRLDALRASLEYECPDFDDHILGDGIRWMAPLGCAADWLASEILDDNAEVSDYGEWLWEPVFGEDSAERMAADGESLRGFAWGALSVWDELDI
ncbi:MAG: hypothetical protein AAFV43_11750 [Planctomycetota bacterium]